LVEERTVSALHDLVAVTKIVRHPAVHVMQTFRSKPPLTPESIVHRASITFTELFYNHKEYLLIHPFRDQELVAPAILPEKSIDAAYSRQCATDVGQRAGSRIVPNRETPIRQFEEHYHR
jgi:hypothetical protein